MEGVQPDGLVYITRAWAGYTNRCCWLAGWLAGCPAGKVLGLHLSCQCCLL